MTAFSCHQGGRENGFADRWTLFESRQVAQGVHQHIGPRIRQVPKHRVAQGLPLRVLGEDDERRAGEWPIGAHGVSAQQREGRVRPAKCGHNGLKLGHVGQLARMADLLGQGRQDRVQPRQHGRDIVRRGCAWDGAVGGFRVRRRPGGRLGRGRANGGRWRGPPATAPGHDAPDREAHKCTGDDAEQKIGHSAAVDGRLRCR